MHVFLQLALEEAAVEMILVWDTVNQVSVLCEALLNAHFVDRPLWAAMVRMWPQKGHSVSSIKLHYLCAQRYQIFGQLGMSGGRSPRHAHNPLSGD